jgi:hypothetical protein
MAEVRRRHINLGICGCGWWKRWKLRAAEGNLRDTTEERRFGRRRCYILWEIAQFSKKRKWWRSWKIGWNGIEYVVLALRLHWSRSMLSRCREGGYLHASTNATGCPKSLMRCIGFETVASPSICRFSTAQIERTRLERKGALEKRVLSENARLTLHKVLQLVNC